MNKKQRKFLLWWLISYGTQKVNFYTIRQQYVGNRNIPDYLFDNRINDMFHKRDMGALGSPFREEVAIPQHIIEELQDERHPA
jgi:hypothetical protein